MKRQEISEKVKDIISYMSEIPLDLCTDSTKLRYELFADDLDLIELLLALEMKFNISIPDDKFEQCTTIEQVINLVELKLNE